MDSDSRQKVLEMLSEGKISVEEAAKLMDRLEGGPSGEVDSPGPDEKAERRGGRPPRFLRVVVDSHDGDKVNVRVPMSLIRTGIKLKALIPGSAAEEMSERGFDLSQLSELDGDELIRALSELTVDVDSADGDKVRVFTE